MIRKVKAYTLIEYMVAITIGLILLAGLATFFIGMKQSTQSQNGISELQENGRFALYFLTNDIQRAGYTDVEASNFFLSPSNHIVFDGTANQTADGGNADTSDAIRISYEGVTDCLGVDVNGGAPGTVTNSYYIANGSLMCQGSAGTQPLIDNVDSMQILYGVDTDNDSSPNKLINATALSANGEADRVVSVKIALLLRSETDVHKTATSQSFQLLNQGTTTAVSDRKLRKIFTTTILIPNKVNIFANT